MKNIIQVHGKGVNLLNIPCRAIASTVSKLSYPVGGTGHVTALYSIVLAFPFGQSSFCPGRTSKIYWPLSFVNSVDHCCVNWRFMQFSIEFD